MKRFLNFLTTSSKSNEGNNRPRNDVMNSGTESEDLDFVIVDNTEFSDKINSNIENIVPKFTARPNGENVLNEYRSSLECIVVTSSMMEESFLHRALSSIPKPPDDMPYEFLVLKIVTKVFGSEYPNVYILEYDYRGDISNDLMGLHDNYGFEKPYLHSCINIIYCNCLKINSFDEIRMIFGLLGRSYRECNARKRMAFSSIVRKTMTLIENNSNTSTNSISNKDRIKNICQEYLDDYKEKAFFSAFLEPTIVYFDLVRDHTQSGDVDVHGSNYYLSLIEATTGIRLPRLPLLNDDGFSGVTEFRESLDSQTLEILQLPENIGKSSKAIPKFKPKVIKRQRNGFIFNEGRPMIPRQLAEIAIRNSDQYKNLRLKFNQYLIPFTNYFSSKVILPRLFTTVINEPGGLDALQSIFIELKENQSSIVSIPTDVDDVRYWIWDDDNNVLNYNAAQEIFSLCGVTKPLNEPSLVESIFKVEHIDNLIVSNNEIKVIPKNLITKIIVAGDARGGGTGREFKENLIEDGYEHWNKWLHPGFHTNSWIRYEFAKPIAITSYGLCSANDCQERDPRTWIFKGYNKIKNEWVDLHNVKDFLFSDRWTWQWFDVNPAEVTMIELQITSNRDRRCRDLQLGHLHLKGLF